MDKRILKQIAKEWSKGILLACEGDAFSDAIERDLITDDEASYIVAETHKIAQRITKEPYIPALTELIKKHYEYE